MIAYFDTSALFKLIVAEEGSQLASRAWEAADTRVTSRVTCPEARAALASAECGGRLTRSAHQRARRTLDDRIEETNIVELRANLARSAGDLAQHHALRGFDAIHLASALATDVDDSVFVTFDQAQAVAAHEVGLTILTGS